MSGIEESIQVHAPLRAVYDQWTQFEEFPKFMEGIKEVRQTDATQVMVQMDFVPEGIVEKLGNALGVPERRVKGDLARFKELVETTDHTAAGWRGEVTRPEAA
jgi:uncharacterized membrane protein